MPDLLIRPTGLDAALMRRVLTPVGARDHRDLVVHPRLVLDAAAAAKYPEFAATARVAGIPLLVDPDTYYLQDVQHADDQWAQLPFARRDAMTPSELTRTAQRELVDAAIDHQIRCGATQVVVPYVHIKSADDGWVDRQICLYRRTREFLDERGIALPTLAIVDVSWRLLERNTWGEALLPLLSEIASVGFDEIGLAASNVQGGAHPELRAASLLASVQRASRTAPVIAWNEGRLGELCVAAGAVGYGSGIGWRETCDTTIRMRDRRTPRSPGPRAPRPVYISKLGRSIPKKTVRDLAGRRGIAPDLTCAPGGCCQNGVNGLLADSRRHTLYARVASLRQLAETDKPFRWSHLRARGEQGLDLARRINVVAGREGLSRVDDAALRAIVACATAGHEHRRVRAA
jgi:hypothetical protein